MRKKIVLTLLFLPLCLLFSQIKQGLVIPNKPKIGLALSGGGAKGFAHVGVLKVLDSLGVKVDYISGTSMGSIVGGLYASGYTGKDIEKIILETDFYTVLANEKNRQESTFFSKSTEKYLFSVPIVNGKFNVVPKSISKGQKNVYMLRELLKNVSTIDDFSKFPIPFLCVGTNLESGKMEAFEKGDLVSSIMASSAYPGLIDPVKIGDSIYIDGAMTVNYPSKLLKDKGMDIVIGVDLSQGLSTRDQLNSAIDILNQVVDYTIQKETKNQYQYTDINIHPLLKGLNATSYGEKEKILSQGRQEALKYVEILNQLPKRQEALRAQINPIFSNVYKIDSLVVLNSKYFSANYVRGKIALKIPSLQTYGSINKMVDKLYATNNYHFINYDIIKKNEKHYLTLDLQEDPTKYYLKFGLHYDEVFKTGLLLNFTAKRVLFRNAIFSIDGIIGDSPRYYLNYFIDNGYIPGLGISASGVNLSLKDTNGNIFKYINWFRNEVYIQSVYKDKYAIGGGISHDYFDEKQGTARYMKSENYINPYVFIKSDTQDDKDFPTRGLYLNSEGKFLDLLDASREKKTIQIRTRLKFHIPISRIVSYSLDGFGGFSLNELSDEYYRYVLGGIFEQNLGNFVSFEGLYFGQKFSPNVLSASNRFQFKISKNIFLISSFNIANQFEDISLKNALKVNNTSLGVTAGYKSPFGQIKLNFATSLESGKGIFNIILGHWF